jgi:hypothetical protein
MISGSGCKILSVSHEEEHHEWRYQSVRNQLAAGTLMEKTEDI